MANPVVNSGGSAPEKSSRTTPQSAQKTSCGPDTYAPLTSIPDNPCGDGNGWLPGTPPPNIPAHAPTHYYTGTDPLNLLLLAGYPDDANLVLGGNREWINPGEAQFPEPPNNGEVYARKYQQWVATLTKTEIEAAINGLRSDLDDHIADLNNPHQTSWDDLQDKPTTFPPDDHNHDDLYYRENEVDAAIQVVQDDLDAHKANADIHFPDAPDDGNQYVRQSNTWQLVDVPDGNKVVETFNVPGHSLTVGQAVRYSGGTLSTAMANTEANAEAVGIVSGVSGDDVTVTYVGAIEGLSGLTPDAVYYLSSTVFGALTATEPGQEGEVSKPMLIARSATTGLVLQMRGMIVTDETVDINHPLYSTTHTDVSVGAPPEIRELLAHNGTDFTLETRMNWRDNWAETTYEKDDVVREGSWTMVANKQTTDHAAPQPNGPEVYFYDGTISDVSTTAKQIIYGQRYTNDAGVYLTGYRIYVTAGNFYEVALIIDPLGSPASSQLLLFEASTDGWTEAGIPSTVLPPNTTFDIVVKVSEPDPTPTVWTGEWVYSTPSQYTAPLSGQISHSDRSLNVLSVHKTDNLGSDKSADLAGMAIGDIINGVDVRWAIQAIQDQGTYIDFTVAPAAQGFPDGNATFSFETVTPTPISYGNDPDHWLAEPNLRGFFVADDSYGNIVLDDDQYGVDVKVQPVIVSDDWDLLAYSGNATGGGSGTPGEGVGEAPNDGALYLRDGQSTIWVADPIQEDAPSDTNEYVRKNGAWVVNTGGGAGVPEAPTDGQDYARNGQGGTWNPTYSKSDADTAFDAAGSAAGVQANLDTHTADTDIHYADATADGTTYGRKDNLWVAIAESPSVAFYDAGSQGTDWTPDLSNGGNQRASLSAGITLQVPTLTGFDGLGGHLLIDLNGHALAFAAGFDWLDGDTPDAGSASQILISYVVSETGGQFIATWGTI